MKTSTYSETSKRDFEEKSFEELCENPSLDRCIHMPKQCVNCNLLGTFENCPDEESLRQIKISLKLEKINEGLQILTNEINSVSKECKDLVDTINEEKRVWEELSKPL